MSIEGSDPNPRPNQETASAENAEAGYTLPEMLEPPVEAEELSRLGRARKFGSDLLKIMMTADKGDIARGISHF